jgi:hypothetical protein
MLRRLLPLFVVLAGLLAACAPTTPALTDPKEIIAKGLEATASLKSAHMELTVDGTLTDPSSGSTFPLSNTSVEGDVDLANQKLAATFRVMGFTGEARFIDRSSYVKLGLTGPKWVKADAAASAFGLPVGALGDVQGAITELRAFLERDGVESRLLDEATCSDRACYHVKVDLSPELLDAAAADAGQSSMTPSELLPEGVALDLYFDREKLYLSRVAIDLTGSQVGDVTASLAFTKFDESVTIDAPPPDQVTEAPSGLPFP